MNISQLISNFTAGFFGNRVNQPRLIHTQGLFYQGFVYDCKNNKLPIHARYSLMPFKVPFTNMIKYNLGALSIRVYKTLDDNILQQTMQNDDTGKSKAFTMSQAGMLADCLINTGNVNPRPETLEPYTPEDTFTNHSYFSKPENIYQALIFADLLTLRLTGNFPFVMRVDNFLKLLGYPELSSTISSNSIVHVNIHKDDHEYPDHYKLVMKIPNRSSINLYLHKTPFNPDTISNILDTNAIKFIHDSQPFNINPKYKSSFWKYTHAAYNYLSNTWQYFTNTLSEDIYEEITREHKRIKKISI